MTKYQIVYCSNVFEMLVQTFNSTFQIIIHDIGLKKMSLDIIFSQFFFISSGQALDLDLSRYIPMLISTVSTKI